MSLYDDPSESIMKYDGACPACHGNPHLCDGTSGECGSLRAMQEKCLICGTWFWEWQEDCPVCAASAALPGYGADGAR